MQVWPSYDFTKWTWVVESIGNYHNRANLQSRAYWLGQFPIDPHHTSFLNLLVSTWWGYNLRTISWLIRPWGAVKLHKNDDHPLCWNHHSIFSEFVMKYMRMRFFSSVGPVLLYTKLAYVRLDHLKLQSNCSGDWHSYRKVWVIYAIYQIRKNRMLTDIVSFAKPED